MRRVAGLATICRAVEGVLAAPSVAGNPGRHQRLLRAALFSTTTNKGSSARSHWFSCNGIAAQAVAGTILFSVATTALVEEVHAKEPVQSKFRPNDVILYQYEACPFCNKVKAFLDYYDIPYKVVEVNPISKKEIKWSDYKKVPILMVDGEQMVDSSDIIDKLTRKIHPSGAIDSVAEDEEKKWRGLGSITTDHELVDYVSFPQSNFSFTERIAAKYAGAAAMYFVSRKLKKKYNITDERAALYEAAETWVDALKGRDFLGGTKPNLADLAVYGVLRPIRYLKSGRDMVENTRIGDWYSRMEAAAENMCFEGMGFGPFAICCMQDYSHMGSAFGVEDGFCLQELQHLDQQRREVHPFVDCYSNLASSSFSCFGSLPVEILQSLSSDLEKQRVELDWFLQLENKRLRRSILQEGTRQQAALMQRYESSIKTLMLQKDQELAIARNKTRELHDFLKMAETEARAWEKAATEKEAIVSDLNNRLNQAKEKDYLFPHAGAHQAYDNMSFCDSSSGSSSSRGEKKGEEPSKKMACKSCQARTLCVVFFPCRHLCCCNSCEALLGHCPVCETVKEASLETKTPLSAIIPNRSGGTSQSIDRRRFPLSSVNTMHNPDYTAVPYYQQQHYPQAQNSNPTPNQNPNEPLYHAPPSYASAPPFSPTVTRLPRLPRPITPPRTTRIPLPTLPFPKLLILSPRRRRSRNLSPRILSPNSKSMERTNRRPKPNLRPIIGLTISRRLIIPQTSTLIPVPPILGEFGAIWSSGTAPKSSTWSGFDDFGRPIGYSSSSSGKERSSNSALKVVRAVPKADTQQDAKSGVQKFRVKLLAESGGQSTMDVLCQIGLDGIRMLDPSTNRILRIYLLDSVTRCEAIESSIFAFWSKTPVDIEPRRIRLKSNSYTTNTLLDTVTAAIVQYKEMSGRSRPPEYPKTAEQPTEKKKGLGDFLNLIKPVNEEKDHWVPDEAVTKCTACGTDFSAFVRKACLIQFHFPPLHRLASSSWNLFICAYNGRTALTADENAPVVRVCDRCLAEVSRRLSAAKDAASRSTVTQSHEDLAKKLQEEMERSCKVSSGSRSDSSGRRMKEVACPTCTVHLQVQVPSSGSETIECGVCQHPFLVTSH
ncbi:protein FREE1 [Sesamum angolense]|uniref:Protein FREE1 n=1 Tax=Sesamum angolense TaxID=2727404 RepID=A0AAE1WCH8_9LAMI|nr:protein FREE1 [Sesamum angolense]